MKKKYTLLILTVTLVVLADQWTKVIIQERFSLYERVEIIPGFFNITHVRNTGGAFGIFGGEKGGLGSFLFVAVSLVAVGILLFLVAKVKEREIGLVGAYGLILGGALGNLLDRLHYGDVVDFLDFYVASFHWPAFNIADSAICVGIGWMAWELWVQDHKKHRPARAP